MQPSKIMLSSLLSLLAFLGVIGSSSGASDTDCTTIESRHQGTDPREDNGEFVLDLDVKEDKVVLGLRGAKGDTFVGFTIEARDLTQMDIMVGSFENLNDEARFSKCGDPKTLVTNRNSNNKTLTTVSWRPPVGYEGQVVFLYSVVKDFSNVWVDLLSRPVTVVASLGLLSNRQSSLVQIVCSACPPRPSPATTTTTTTTTTTRRPPTTTTRRPTTTTTRRPTTTTTRRPTTTTTRRSTTTTTRRPRTTKKANLIKTTTPSTLVFNPLPENGTPATCLPSETCQSATTCPWYEAKVAEIATHEKGSDQYWQIINQLRDKVCQKEKKRICCPKNNLGGSRLELRGGGNLARGNVYVDGLAVCSRGWNMAAAAVTCRALGFARAEAATTESKWGPAGDDFSMTYVWCTGDEASLRECQFETKPDKFCHRGKAAGVVCQ